MENNEGVEAWRSFQSGREASDKTYNWLMWHVKGARTRRVPHDCSLVKVQSQQPCPSLSFKISCHCTVHAFFLIPHEAWDHPIAYSLHFFLQYNKKK